MCGRFALATPPEQLALFSDEFELPTNFFPRYNRHYNDLIGGVL